MSIIAMAGTRNDLLTASAFPPEVKWDQVVQVEIPDDHGEFPDTSAYDREDFADFETKMEDDALFPYMTKCVDVVLNFTTKKADGLAKLNFRNIHGSMHGMKTGGKMFVVAGFVDYEPLRVGKGRPFSLIVGGN